MRIFHLIEGVGDFGPVVGSLLCKNDAISTEDIQKAIYKARLEVSSSDKIPFWDYNDVIAQLPEEMQITWLHTDGDLHI